MEENEPGVADDAAEVKEMQDTVLHTYKAADGYSYDTKHHLWCELSFAVGFFCCLCGKKWNRI